MQPRPKKATRRPRQSSFYLSRERFAAWDAVCALGDCRRRPLIESQFRGEVQRRFERVSEQKQARRFYVSGRVQGVGYRFFVCEAAERQGIGGYARNLHDGRVEVYAVGTLVQLEALLAELRCGPRHAWVEQVSQAEAEWLPRFASRFSIEQD
jgi:acylphosphatase